jgi:hypothetical protein
MSERSAGSGSSGSVEILSGLVLNLGQLAQGLGFVLEIFILFGRIWRPSRPYRRVDGSLLYAVSIRQKRLAAGQRIKRRNPDFDPGARLLAR